MSTLRPVEQVSYSTPDGGTVTVRFDAPEWVVDDNGTEHRFANVRGWISYVRESYSWPLPLVS